MRALFVVLMVIAFAGCATVKVSPLPPAGSKPTPTITSAATAVATVAPSGSPRPLATSATPLAYYGLQTNRIHPYDPLKMEYSDQLFVNYPVGVDLAAFRAGLTISPVAPIYATYPFVNQGGLPVRIPIVPSGGVSLSIRFVPGVTYHIAQPAFGIAMDVATAPLTINDIPAPVRAIAGSPYYYGFLNHPWAFGGFLGGFNYSATDTRPSAIAARADSIETLKQIVASGAGNVRMDFCSEQTIYPDVTIAPKWFHLDPILHAVTDAGITVLPIIQQHCAYARNPNGNTMDTPEHYARWAGAVADHLKTFPTITRVELFNEPNLRGGWNPGAPSPAPSTSPLPGPYAATDGTGAAPFMRAAYVAIKAANPNLIVVAGALAAGGHHVGVKTWMNGAMDAGCKIGVCWDELSIHNYRWAEPSSATIANDPTEDNRFDVYKDAQNVAIAHGDPKPKVMLTEFGFSSCDGLTVCFDPMVQALYLAQGFNLALADPTIDGVTYVNIYNSSNDIPDHFWSATALVNNDRTTKPGYDVFAKFAQGSR